MFRILSTIAIIASLFSANALAGNQIFSSSLNANAPTTVGDATDCSTGNLPYN